MARLEFSEGEDGAVRIVLVYEAGENVLAPPATTAFWWAKAMTPGHFEIRQE